MRSRKSAIAVITELYFLCLLGCGSSADRMDSTVEFVQFGESYVTIGSLDAVPPKLRHLAREALEAHGITPLIYGSAVSVPKLRDVEAVKILREDAARRRYEFATIAEDQAKRYFIADDFKS